MDSISLQDKKEKTQCTALTKKGLQCKNKGYNLTNNRCYLHKKL